MSTVAAAPQNNNDEPGLHGTYTTVSPHHIFLTGLQSEFSMVSCYGNIFGIGILFDCKSCSCCVSSSLKGVDVSTV